jgi:hypothetical protein
MEGRVGSPYNLLQIPKKEEFEMHSSKMASTRNVNHKNV